MLIRPWWQLKTDVFRYFYPICAFLFKLFVDKFTTVPLKQKYETQIVKYNWLNLVSWFDLYYGLNSSLQKKCRVVFSTLDVSSPIGYNILDTYAGKQLSLAATDD